MGIASFGFGIPSLPITIVNMVSFIPEGYTSKYTEGS